MCCPLGDHIGRNQQEHIDQGVEPVSYTHLDVYKRQVYDELTLELLLGNVEPDIQAEYQRKVLRGLSPEDLSLLRVYYEEDMSLTATGRRLFMHKNTLQYKLDRIYRLCGLNPRRFQDALLICLGLKLS